jgi:hypothetical protein
MATIQGILRRAIPVLPQDGELKVRDLMNTAFLMTSNPVADSFAAILDAGVRDQGFRQRLTSAVRDVLSTQGGELQRRMMEQGMAMGTSAKLFDPEQLTAAFMILKSKGMGAVNQFKEDLGKGADAALKGHIDKVFGFLAGITRAIPIGGIRNTMEGVMTRTTGEDDDPPTVTEGQKALGITVPLGDLSGDNLGDQLPGLFALRNSVLPMGLKSPVREIKAQTAQIKANMALMKAVEGDTLLRDTLMAAYQEAFQTIIPDAAANALDGVLTSGFNAPVNRMNLDKFLNLDKQFAPQRRAMLDLVRRRVTEAYEAVKKPVPAVVTEYLEAVETASTTRKTPKLLDLVKQINQLKHKLKGGTLGTDEG